MRQHTLCLRWTFPPQYCIGRASLWLVADDATAHNECPIQMSEIILLWVFQVKWIQPIFSLFSCSINWNLEVHFSGRGCPPPLNWIWKSKVLCTSCFEPIVGRPHTGLVDWSTMIEKIFANVAFSFSLPSCVHLQCSHCWLQTASKVWCYVGLSYGVENVEVSTTPPLGSYDYSFACILWLGICPPTNGTPPFPEAKGVDVSTYLRG